jgi:hypothetical protein
MSSTHIFSSFSTSRARFLYRSFPCAGYLGHPFRKRRLESDLLVPFCLQERSGKGRSREHSYISHFDTFLSLRKGEACVSYTHSYQATNSASLLHAIFSFCSSYSTTFGEVPFLHCPVLGFTSLFRYHPSSSEATLLTAVEVQCLVLGVQSSRGSRFSAGAAQRRRYGTRDAASQLCAPPST